jgi:hypothetical protein
LDHDDCVRQGDQHPVALVERSRSSAEMGRERPDHRARTARDPSEQRRVAFGIAVKLTRPGDAPRATTAAHGSPVRRRVDAGGSARSHDQTGICERRGQLPREAE